VKKREGSWRTLNFGKMKITQEEFDTLKQLDRIEYRQKKGEIDNRFECGVWNFIWYMIICGFICLLMSMVMLQYDTEVSLLILDIADSLGFITFCFMILNMIMIIVFSIIRTKKINEIQNEYFDFKTEVKK